jgi:nitrogenase molybdenum-iron protein NifN
MSASSIAAPKTRPHFLSTRNACKLCAPLGACLALRGIEGSIPFLHGSQGCATYMRRYIISHFREPMDIAASNFNEASAIFGGGDNLHLGLRNVTAQYHPALIGIATTCLTETIGEDVERLLDEYRTANAGTELPELFATSTASYRGTHVDGFHATVRSAVSALAQAGERHSRINVLPGMVSPADLRYLKEIFADFDVPLTLLPDYSETLDGPALANYERIPAGGTPTAAIRAMGGALATLEFGRTLAAHKTAGALLEESFGVSCYRLGLPIGVQETDRLYQLIEKLSGAPTPASHQLERGRLIDAYVDGHKYVFGKRAIVYGDEDLVVGLTAFLSEIGIVPVLCASGGESRLLARAIDEVTDGLAAAGAIRVREGADFMDIGEEAAELKPDLLIGNSKGYASARHLGVPLIRVGFPIHDRIGGQRILHLGYRGAQRLFDEVVNTLLERKQDDSSVGYSYM